MNHTLTDAHDLCGTLWKCFHRVFPVCPGMYSALSTGQLAEVLHPLPLDKGVVIGKAIKGMNCV